MSGTLAARVNSAEHERAHPFAGRRAVIVTKHGKERALDPLLRGRLGMYTEVLQLDTDRFGTFTGEVARAGSQLDALREKLRAGAEATPYDAVIVASEGSFSVDPYFPIVTLDIELVGLYDPSGEIEIVGRAIAPAAHAFSAEVTDENALAHALTRIGFPDHAAVLHDGLDIHKGLRERGRIGSLVRAAWRRGVTPRIESDARAFMNPTRMALIAAACEDALALALSRCLRCAGIGYGLRELLRGLPCRDCGETTDMVCAELWGCRACGFTERRPRSDDYADPASCPLCNP